MFRDRAADQVPERSGTVQHQVAELVDIPESKVLQSAASGIVPLDPNVVGAVDANLDFHVRYGGRIFVVLEEDRGPGVVVGSGDGDVDAATPARGAECHRAVGGLVDIRRCRNVGPRPVTAQEHAAAGRPAAQLGERHHHRGIGNQRPGLGVAPGRREAATMPRCRAGSACRPAFPRRPSRAG